MIKFIDSNRFLPVAEKIYEKNVMSVEKNVKIVKILMEKSEKKLKGGCNENRNVCIEIVCVTIVAILVKNVNLND